SREEDLAVAYHDPFAVIVLLEVVVEPLPLQEAVEEVEFGLVPLNDILARWVAAGEPELKILSFDKIERRMILDPLAAGSRQFDPQHVDDAHVLEDLIVAREALQPDPRHQAGFVEVAVVHDLVAETEPGDRAVDPPGASQVVDLERSGLPDQRVDIDIGIVAVHVDHVLKGPRKLLVSREAQNRKRVFGKLVGDKRKTDRVEFGHTLPLVRFGSVAGW